VEKRRYAGQNRSTAEKDLIVLSSNLTQTIKINNKNLIVEVAETLQQKMIGLKKRKFLKENHGMLFIYNIPQKLDFWMEDTFISLDIAYIDQNKKIKEIYSLKPLDIKIVSSKAEDLCYALETNQGWFSKNDIHIGDQLYF